MLKAENITFRYAGEDILQQMSCCFPSGMLTGIIGPNGSGKSTLLRLLSGEKRPLTGQILLDGEPVSDMPARRLARRMSVVPQQSHMDFAFSALEVVLMGRQACRARFEPETARDVELAREALSEMGLASLEKRSVTALSGGEWQRVVIARAICQDTPVMLLDEPVSSLDIRHQLEVLRLLKRLCRERERTVVCVLHDLNLAAHFCDRLLLIHNQNAYASGSPEEVLTSENIRTVYGVKTNIIRDGGLRVLPVYEEE